MFRQYRSKVGTCRPHRWYVSTVSIKSWYVSTVSTKIWYVLDMLVIAMTFYFDFSLFRTRSRTRFEKLMEILEGNFRM